MMIKCSNVKWFYISMYVDQPQILSIMMIEFNSLIISYNEFRIIRELRRAQCTRSQQQSNNNIYTTLNHYIWWACGYKRHMMNLCKEPSVHLFPVSGLSGYTCQEKGYI